MSPGSNCMHALTVHATTPTQVAGCIEGGDGGGIDIDLVGEIEEWRGGAIRLKLILKEVL